MSEIKITIGLDADTKALLTDLKEALLQTRPNCERCMRAVSDSMNHICTGMDAEAMDEATLHSSEPATAPKEPAPAPSAPAPAPAPTESTPAPEPAPVSTKVYTMDDVRAAVMQLCRLGDGPKQKAKELLQQFAPSLSELPADKYDEFMTKLGAIA